MPSKKTDTQWKTGMCDGCGITEIEVTKHRDSLGGKNYNFCQYCFSTLGGNMHMNPSSYDYKTSLIVQHVNRVANVMEKRISKALAQHVDKLRKRKTGGVLT